MRPELIADELAAIQPRFEAPLLELELGLISRRERELTLAAAGHLGGNPLFEHWL